MVIKSHLADNETERKQHVERRNVSLASQPDLPAPNAADMNKDIQIAMK